MELPNTLPDSHEVHVWCIELAAEGAAIQACSRTLSADEKERAAQFRFEHLKAAFTLSRGILRALLGHYLGVEPGGVRFAYGPRGKPRLAFPEAALQFNLAHSGKFAVYAFAVGCELGVDVEEIRPQHDQHDQEGIVRRFFAPEECEDWLAFDVSQRDEAFFRGWTRKEAYIKALGDGLSMPLDSFRVSLQPELSAALLYAAGDPAAAGKWLFYSLKPADGYIGSLAVPDPFRKISLLPPLSAAGVLQLPGK